MDTNLKNAISAMRKDIAELEKKQKETKPQRKTERFKGERTMPAWVATDQARANKEKLRIFYAAYGLLRGKNFNITERNAKPIELDKYYEQTGRWLNNDLAGKHPLFVYLNEINNTLKTYGYQFKNYEEKKDRWGYTYKSVSFENYEEVVCVSE